MVCPQLPVKYPQLPALMIGQIETLIWRIPHCAKNDSPMLSGQVWIRLLVYRSMFPCNLSTISAYNKSGMVPLSCLVVMGSKQEYPLASVSIYKYILRARFKDANIQGGKPGLSLYR